VLRIPNPAEAVSNNILFKFKKKQASQIGSCGIKKIQLHVRFQVLTAASMMFRVVFWVILPPAQE
jgi:hypothetical protein